MKKGCIFRSIIFITIFVAVALYVFQQKFGGILNLSHNEFVLPILQTDLIDKLKLVKDSPQKINFENMINDAKSGIDFIKELPSEKIDEINETFVNIFSDSIITEKELNYVRELFKKIKK